MIRIALVEDEAEVRAQLQGYVQRTPGSTAPSSR